MRDVGKNANAQIFVINLFACIIWEGSRLQARGVRSSVRCGMCNENYLTLHITTNH